MRGIISRFAPAPTGFLHLGHVANAVHVWRETRARHGCVLLRIEDHDRRRSRRHFEEALLEDLAWLGFEADEPPVRQSERGAVYESALDGLRRRGLVYACHCSRTDVVRALDRGGPQRAALHDVDVARDDADVARHDADVADVARAFQARGVAPAFQARGEPELRYPGTCRDRGLAEGPGLGLRVRLDPSVERFVDLRLGQQEQWPSEQCGDLLVRDRDGDWTYQFAATVDDYVQGVTLVIRGADLLASTGRQIQLARLLGRAEPPEFLHHGLIMKPVRSASGRGGPGAASTGGASPRQKLSKSDADTGIRELRARGWTAAQVIDAALAALEP